MAFIINTFAVLNDKYLGRLVMHAKFFSDFIGDRSVVDNIKVIKIHTGGTVIFIKAVLCHAANGAAGAMLKDNLRIF